MSLPNHSSIAKSMEHSVVDSNVAVIPKTTQRGALNRSGTVATYGNSNSNNASSRYFGGAAGTQQWNTMNTSSFSLLSMPSFKRGISEYLENPHLSTYDFDDDNTYANYDINEEIKEESYEDVIEYEFEPKKTEHYYQDKQDVLEDIHREEMDRVEEGEDEEEEEDPFFAANPLPDLSGSTQHRYNNHDYGNIPGSTDSAMATAKSMVHAAKPIVKQYPSPSHHRGLIGSNKDVVFVPDPVPEINMVAAAPKNDDDIPALSPFPDGPFQATESKSEPQTPSFVDPPTLYEPETQIFRPHVDHGSYCESKDHPLARSIPDPIFNNPEVTRYLVNMFILTIWNKGDIAAIRYVCHPNICFNGMDNQSECKGHENFARIVVSMKECIPNFHCTIQSMVVEGNKCFCRLKFTGRHEGGLLMGFPSTGKAVEWQGATEFTCQDGKILKIWEIGDMMALERTLVLNTAGDPNLQRENCVHEPSPIADGDENRFVPDIPPASFLPEL